MNYRSAIVLAGAVCLGATCIRPAHASLYYVTYTGTASGTDTYGLFGTAGATLQGAAFTSTFTYDPTLFGSGYSQTDGQAVALGGQYFATTTPQLSTSPILSADLAIDGTTASQGAGYYGVQELQYYAGFSDGGSIATYVSSGADSSLQFAAYSAGALVADLTALQSLSLTPSEAGEGNGYFEYHDEILLLDATNVSITDVDAFGTTSPPSSSPTDVPEPGTSTLLAGAAIFVVLVGGGRQAVRHRVGKVIMPSGPLVGFASK